MPAMISRAELRALIDAVQLVDVLAPDEYRDLHLPGAVNIPLREIARQAPRELSPTDPVVVYCHDAL